MDPSEFKVSESLAATGSSTELTDREKHLIGLAVVLTRGCQFCTGGRMEKAITASVCPREQESSRVVTSRSSASKKMAMLRCPLVRNQSPPA